MTFAKIDTKKQVPGTADRTTQEKRRQTRFTDPGTPQRPRRAGEGSFWTVSADSHFEASLLPRECDRRHSSTLSNGRNVIHQIRNSQLIVALVNRNTISRWALIT